ncbi:hypothetical protein BC828DRAFT_245390 [Blastocladiella britannica]|nr:hypothetical protein BC828DRAFT_245390 [Blastocladiella britannica]
MLASSSTTITRASPSPPNATNPNSDDAVDASIPSAGVRGGLRPHPLYTPSGLTGITASSRHSGGAGARSARPLRPDLYVPLAPRTPSPGPDQARARVSGGRLAAPPGEKGWRVWVAVAAEEWERERAAETDGMAAGASESSGAINNDHGSLVGMEDGSAVNVGEGRD